MTKRPPQGRGSGGRVTPSVKATEAAAKAASDDAEAPKGGRGRLLKSTRQPKSAEPATPEPAGRTSGRKDRSAATAVADPPSSPPDDGTEPLGDAPVWGMGDMFIWWFVSLVASAVGYVLISSAFVSTGSYVAFWPNAEGWAIGEVAGRIGVGQAPQVTVGINGAPLWLQVLLQIPLWIALVAGPAIVVWRKGLSWERDFGWSFRWKDAPLGLGLGVASQLLLIPGIYWLLFKLVGEQDISANARALTDRADDLWGVLALVVIVGIGAPIAEEIFYRGLSQHAIAKRFGPRVGVLGSAVFFAGGHFQPWEFIGLFAFGLVLGALTSRFDRLGPAVYAHIGFNLTAAAVLVWNLPVA